MKNALRIFSIICLFSGVVFTNSLAQNYRSTIPETQGGDFEIRSISDAAVDENGNVYIADSRDGSILIFSITEGFRIKMNSFHGPGGTADLRNPAYVTVDINNRIYIADDRNNEVYVLNSDYELLYKVGTSGRNPGEFRNIKDIAVDSDSYLYVLDSSNNRVEIFDDEGNYVTWITGPTDSPKRLFNNPVAIGINGLNQLYVLENNAVALHIFNDFGSHIKSFEQLGSAGSLIQNAQSLAVFNNGHFTILDSDNGNLSLFNSSGEFLQRTGRSSRRASPGIFQNPLRLSSNLSNPYLFFVVDAGANNVQMYEYNHEIQSATLREKIKAAISDQSIPAFHDAVFAPNGTLYYIPEGNLSTVIALDTHTGYELFQLPAERAHRLATDDESNVYILDAHRRSNEVFVFNSDGVLKFSVGQDVANPLRDPNAIAVKSDGTIMVSDLRHDRIHQWEPSGRYIGDGISLTQFDARVISFMRTDSHDNIYLLDQSINGIYRLNAAGMLTDSQPLTLKGFDPSRGEAEIMWFDIDLSDQLHVYNSTTSQYHIIEWKPSVTSINYPETIFRFGREGRDELSFNRATHLVLDQNNLVAHVKNRRGREILSFDVIIRPPKPELELFAFSKGDGHLQLIRTISSDGITSSYALMQENIRTGELTEISVATDTITVINPDQDESLFRYRLIGLSASNRSEPSEAFPDYIGRGSYFARQEQYIEAFEQYLNGINYYEKTADQFQNNIALDLLGWAEVLTNRNEAHLTTLILRNASLLLDERDPVNRQISQILNTLFNTLYRRGEYERITGSVDNLLSIQSDIVIDEVSRNLGRIARNLTRTGIENRVLQSMTIYNKLLEWTNNSDWALAGIADAQFAHYNILKTNNSPYVSTNLRLNNAKNAVDEALEKIQLVSDLYNETRILQLQILIESGEFEDVINIAERELSDQVPGIAEEYFIAYRELAGDAASMTGDYGRSIYNATELVQLNPADQNYQVRLAHAYFNAERYNEALSMYRELHMTYPTVAEYLARIGQVEYAMGNYAEATYQLEQAVQLDSKTTWFYGVLASAFYRNGRYNDAIAYYELVIGEAKGRFEMARSRQAPQLLVQSLRDELETYLFQYGRANLRIRNYSLAVDAFEELVSLVANEPQYWFELGNAYTNSGQVYAAEGAFFRASTLDTTNNQYRGAYSDARAESDQYAANQPPVRILSLSVRPIFPSIYKSYTEDQSFGEAVIENNTQSVVTNARLEVKINRYTDDSYFIDLPAISPRSNTSVPLFTNFSSDILSNNSDITTQIQVQLVYNHQGESRAAETSNNIVIHRRSAIDWGDKRRLASFISPGNEALRQFISEINTNLREIPGLDLPSHISAGARIYTALHNSGYVYQRDPNIENILNEGILDDIQYPAETLMLRSGECDDFVVMLSNLLESQGIQTAYIDVPGHVFMALNTELSPNEIDYLNLDRNLFIIQNQEVWLPIETTLIGRAGFIQAWQNGASRWYAEREQGNFPQLIQMDSAQRIYSPSEYTPSTFSSPVQFTGELIKDYEDTMMEIYATFNEGMLQRLGERISEEPNNLFLINQLGVLLARTGEEERAEEIFLRGLRIYPESPQINNNLANLYFSQRKYEEALQYYQSSAENNSNNAEVFINLARALYETGQFEEAKRSFRSGISIDYTMRDRYDFLYDKIFL